MAQIFKTRPAPLPILGSMKKTTFRLAAGALLSALALHQGVHAVDSASLPASVRLANARALIEAKDWKGAIAELQGVDAPNNADWNNLMGFSLRKARTPDYAAAERFYDTALRIEPSHRGALSYSGELYLLLDNLPKAQQRLTTLKLVCNNACFEQERLSQAIERYKAAGNKYIPEP
jgi:Flp pilus assembly protein TadD